MEYAIYVYLAILTIILAFKGTTTQSKKLDYLLFVSLIVLSLVVRQAPHNDMLVYIDNMKVPPYLLLGDKYWIKHIVYWGATSILYHWGLSPFIIFIIIDTITFALFLRARTNKELPYYFIPLFYVSFIGVFGLQNIYRQYIASVLLIYIFSIINKRPILGYALFIIAVLIHNSSLVLIGALFLEHHKEKINKYLFFLGIIIITVASPFVFSTDYLKSTGENYNTLYLTIILLLALFMLFTHQQTKRIISQHKISSFQIPLYFVLIAISSFLIMGISLHYERLMILLLPFMILLSIQYIQFYKTKRLLNVTISLLIMLPTFTFQATTMMLENNLAFLDD